jgi:hypothetical protein
MSSALEEGDEPVDFLPDQHRLGNRQLLGTGLVGKLVRTRHRRLQADREDPLNRRRYCEVESGKLIFRLCN